MKFFVRVCAIVALATSGLAMKCATCKGTDCDSDIPMETCNPRHPYPLVGSISTTSKVSVLTDNTYYVCLYLEYVQGDGLEKVGQCIVSTVGDDVCSSLREIYNVTVCVLSKPLTLEIELPVFENENHDTTISTTNNDLSITTASTSNNDLSTTTASTFNSDLSTITTSVVNTDISTSTSTTNSDLSTTNTDPSTTTNLEPSTTSTTYTTTVTDSTTITAVTYPTLSVISTTRNGNFVVKQSSAGVVVVVSLSYFLI